LGLGLLHFRAGFGVPDERPVPEELWGEDLTRAVRAGEAILVLADATQPAWRQAERAHLLIPIRDASGATRGVLIASTEQLDVPEDLVDHAQGLAPLLEFTEGSPRRIADDLERDIGSSLWAALLTVQDADDPRGRRAARALAASLADLRSMVLSLR